MLNRLKLQTMVADGYGHDFFWVNCPQGHLNAVSRYSREGSYQECDYFGCLQQFWFSAGEFAEQRLFERD